MSVGTFDYVEFNPHIDLMQQDIKQVCICLEREIFENLKPSRERSIALTKLEELFMWIGKACRHDQLEGVN
jgi:hypothetical protein